MEQISEEEAEESFMFEDNSAWNAPDTKFRHQECRKMVNHHHVNPSRLRADWLRACRQIYDEGKHIVYAMNTFSFSSPITLSRFVYRQTNG